MSNLARKLNPADIAASAASNQNSPKGTKKAGGQRSNVAQHTLATGIPIADFAAKVLAQPVKAPPHVSNPIVEAPNALDFPNQQERAVTTPQPIIAAPAPAWSSGHIALDPYMATPEITETVNSIMNLHRLRQGMIKAQTKLTLQAKASIRCATQTDDDFASDDAKAAARKRNDDLYKVVEGNPDHPLHANLLPYLAAVGPLQNQCKAYAKEMESAVKRLPIYAWAKNVEGLGDVSLAALIGECGDIGTYKSVSAVWKRLGLAVMGSLRQGNPGKDASADDWIAHGYSGKRRSVSYVASEHIIRGMGRWRPMFGEDVQANDDLTYYQKVFAERARYEAEKLGLPVTESKTGKESYKAHVARRAHRYTEKRMLKHLYIEWRRA